MGAWDAMRAHRFVELRLWLGIAGAVALTLLSAAVAIVGFVVGMVVSYVYEAPSGASIVCVNIVLFGLFAIIGGIINAVKKN